MSPTMRRIWGTIGFALVGGAVIALNILLRSAGHLPPTPAVIGGVLGLLVVGYVTWPAFEIVWARRQSAADHGRPERR